MTETEEQIIKDRAEIYSNKQIPVHITKHDGEWLNGFVTEVSDEFLMLDEFQNKIMPVFFREIKNIQTYTKEVKE